jgi:hypothetical protein
MTQKNKSELIKKRNKLNQSLDSIDLMITKSHTDESIDLDDLMQEKRICQQSIKKINKNLKEIVENSTPITAEYFEGKEEWFSYEYEECKGTAHEGSQHLLKLGKGYWRLMVRFRYGEIELYLKSGTLGGSSVQLNCNSTEELEDKIEHAKQLFT